jgi:hypothetical protein
MVPDPRAGINDGVTCASCRTFLFRSVSIGSGLDLVSDWAARGKSCPRRGQRLPHASPNAARNQPTPCLTPVQYLPRLSPEPAQAPPKPYLDLPDTCPILAETLPNI